MNLNFEERVYMQIGGEQGKNNSLSLIYFAEIAKNLQILIDKLALGILKTDDGFDAKNFKLELVDFQKGSAVPGFSFSKSSQAVIGADVQKQRSIVSKGFDDLLSVANSGDYYKLSEMHLEEPVKNDLIQVFYNFTSSLKTPKIAFGSFDSKEGFAPKYTVKRFKKSVKDALVQSPTQTSESETHFVYGRIQLTTQNGKERKVIKDIFQANNTKLSHVFTEITTDKHQYKLTAPLYCSLMKNEDKGFSIESEMLQIAHTGKSREDAIQQFSEKFHENYVKLNETKYSDLTETMRVVKTFYTVLVK